MKNLTLFVLTIILQIWINLQFIKTMINCGTKCFPRWYEPWNVWSPSKCMYSDKKRLPEMGLFMWINVSHFLPPKCCPTEVHAPHLPNNIFIAKYIIPAHPLRSSRVQITPNRYIVYQIIWIYLKYIFIHTKVSHENTAYNSIFNFSVTHYSLWLLLHRHCHLLCVESVCCIELKREIKLLLLLVCNLHHLWIVLWRKS